MTVHPDIHSRHGSLTGFLLLGILTQEIYNRPEPGKEFRPTVYTPWSNKLAANSQFRNDNKHSGLPCTKLVLRGQVVPECYSKGKCIRTKEMLRDRTVWQLEVDVYETDLVIYIFGYVDSGRICYHEPEDWTESQVCDKIGGLWLLRPAGNDEFKLIACLQEFDEVCFFDKLHVV
jgi:hypothetical protein